MKSKGIFTRILSAILCAIMIIGMVPVAIAAEGEALALEVGTVELALDDSAVDGYYTVNVPINVTANTGFNALKFAVTYNEALELIGWTNGTVMSDTHNHTPALENATSLSPFTVTYGNITNAENSTATGKLIELQFKVADTVAAGTNLPVSVEVTEAYVQGDALDPVAITASVTAGGVNVAEALPEGILSRTYGKDLSITWGGYYGRNGVKGAIDGNAVYSTASDGWQPDTTWPKITINNLDVPEGAKKLILNAKIYSSQAARSIENNIIINGTTLSVNLRPASEAVTPVEIDLTSLGDISTISSMVIHPFVINGGEMRNVEVRFESIEFSSVAAEVQDPNTIYGKDLTVSWGGYYTAGSCNGTIAVDGNDIVATAKNGWWNDGCADYTIKNIPVPAGAKYLTLNIKTLSNDVKTTAANVTIDGTAFDANFAKSAQQVAAFTFDLTSLGTISTISNMKIVSFANKAELQQTEVRIESIVFSEEAPEGEASANVVYGKDIVFGLGGMYDGPDYIVYEGNTAIIPAGSKNTQSTNWDNDGCALITAKGLTFPATNKYIVVGIATDVDNASKPGARPSSTKNVEIYVDGVNTGYNDVDLASYEGQNVFAHVIDASSKITSGTTITDIVFDPIPNTKKGATKSDLTRFGANGNFRVDFIAAFATLDEANKYAADYNASKLAKVTFKADGVQFGEVITLKKGDALVLPATAPTKAGYVFQGWDVAAGTIVTEDITVNAIFVEASSPTIVKYGKDLAYSLGGIYQSTIDYEDNAAILRPDPNGTKDTGWDNDNCALVKVNNLDIPTTHKYYVFGVTTYIDKTSYPSYVASTTKNLEFYVDGTLINTMYNLNLNAHLGSEAYAHVFDASSILTSGESVTNIRFDPLPNKNRANGSPYKYGKGGYFKVDFIAAFDSLEGAEAYATEYNSSKLIEVTFMADGVQFGEKSYVTMGGGLVYPAATPTKEGYTFAGWDVPAGTTVNDALTVNALFIDNSYVYTGPVVLNADMIPAVKISNMEGAYDETTGLFTATTTKDITNSDNENSYVLISFGNTPVHYPAIKYVKIGYEFNLAGLSAETGDNVNIGMTIGGASSRFWGFNTSQFTAEKGDWILSLDCTGKGGQSPFNTSTYAKAIATDTYDYVRFTPWKRGSTIPTGTSFSVKYIAFFTDKTAAENFVYTTPEKIDVTYMVDGMLYEVKKTNEGSYINYPDVDPYKPGYAFAGWDVEASTVITEPITVNAKFETPAALVTFENGASVSGFGNAVLNKVKATETTDSYYRFTSADTTAEFGNNDYADFMFSGNVKDNPVLLIRYRTNLEKRNFDVNPYFAGQRIYGTNNPTTYNDGEWHNYVLDLSAQAWSGGGFGDYANQGFETRWNYCINKHGFNGIKISPFYGTEALQQEGGYMDIDYIALFKTVEAAENYVHPERDIHTVTYYANGAVYATEYASDNTGLVYPDVNPAAPAGYKFNKWDVAKGTVIRKNTVVNAVFTPASSSVASSIVYAPDMTVSLGSIYGGGTTTTNGNIVTYQPTEQKARDWDNDGCATITFSNLNIPATNKYLVFAMSTKVGLPKDGNTYEQYVSHTDNVQLYVDGVALTDWIDVNLAANIGSDIVAYAVDASSIIASGSTITGFKINPIMLKTQHSSGKKSRYGAGGNFNIEFVAGFETLAAAQEYANGYNLPVVNVTVTAGEGGSVLGESGEYAEGSKVTFTAVPADGYVFDAWYIAGGNTLVSTDAIYALTVSEEIALEARFVPQTGKTVAKLEVETVEDDTLGSVEIDDVNYAGGYAATGTAVTVTATATNVGKFAYWKRVTAVTGASVYLGITEDIGAYALGADVYYQPVFFDADAPKATIYVDATNKILTENGTVPADPEMPGYKFEGWVAIAENDVVAVMAPKFTAEFNETIGLTVITANGQKTVITPSFNEQLGIDAGADNVVWTLKIGNKSYPVSYNRYYTLRHRITAESATLTAQITSAAPKAVINGIEAVRVGDATRFVGTYFVPAEYTVIGYGMLLTSDATLAEDMNIGTDGVIVGNLATSNNPDYQMFVVNKNKTTDQTWYGRAFLIYSTDGGATSTVIYGETISK